MRLLFFIIIRLGNDLLNCRMFSGKAFPHPVGQDDGRHKHKQGDFHDFLIQRLEQRREGVGRDVCDAGRQEAPP